MYKVIKNKKSYSTTYQNGTAFVLPNLLTKKLKADRRFYIVQRIRQYIAAIVLGIIIGLLFGCAMFYPYKTSPQAIKQTIEVKAVEVTTTPKITWNDAIREVFPKDEAGKMIRICMKENGKQNPYALNENTNGTYDYSWCQVNSCHKPKNMTDDQWKENLRDPMFNAQQVKKIYLSQGWGAWVVFNKGLVR